MCVTHINEPYRTRSFLEAGFWPLYPSSVWFVPLFWISTKTRPRSQQPGPSWLPGSTPAGFQEGFSAVWVYVCDTQDSFMCVTGLVCMCDMTAFVCVTNKCGLLVCMYVAQTNAVMSHIQTSPVTHMNESCVSHTNKCRHVDRICWSHQQMESCHTYKLVTWRHLLVCHSTLCDMACLYVAPRVWCDSLMCVTWLIHTCDLTAFICVTWLVYMCDMFWWLVKICEMAMCDMTAFICVKCLVKHPCVTWKHSYVWNAL